MDSLGWTLGGIFGAHDMAAARAAAIAGGSFLGAGGYFIALITAFLPGSDPVQQYLENEFALVKAKLATLAVQIKSIPNKVESSNALQTYIENRNGLLAVNTAFREFGEAMGDTSLLALVTQQCDIHAPHFFLQQQLTSLTADGACDFPTQCWLAPNAGAAQQVAYNRTAFLDWVKVFLQDSCIAATYTALCPAAEGAMNNTLTGITRAAQDTHVKIAMQLESYYNGVMTTAFWQYQFNTDVTNALNSGGSNSDLSKALTDLLSSKYDFLKWSAVVWDSATGSDKQGFTNPYCNTNPPDARCTGWGGMYAMLRATLTNGGGARSYAIWWSPFEESPADAAKYQVAIDNCRVQTNGDMVNLVGCLSEGISSGSSPERGLVCLAKGELNEGSTLDATVTTVSVTRISDGFSTGIDALCFIHPPA